MNIKPIPEYPGYYTSECGRLFSDWKNNGQRDPNSVIHELIPRKNKDGYLVSSVRLGKKRKNTSIHRLVAMTWCSGYQSGLTVNHIDSVKDNNVASNLEWVTRGENIRHSVVAGKRIFKYSGTGWGRSVWRIPSDRPNAEKTISPSLSQASREIGIDAKRGAPHIHAAINGKRRTAYGFVWGYAMSV